MLKDQCISVTELRTRTKKCLKKTDDAPQFIFFNNHPIAVLVGIAEYEERMQKPQLMEIPMSSVGSTLTAQAKRAKKTKKTDLVNIR